MNTGDLGHVDAGGRLMIDGREDDMIVSGGENVFPQEVADVLARHERVADVAVIGVDDPEFGQRLRAFVVVAPGGEPTPDELKATSSRISRATRCRATSSSSTRCRAIRAARSSPASSPTRHLPLRQSMTRDNVKVDDGDAGRRAGS